LKHDPENNFKNRNYQKENPKNLENFQVTRKNIQKKMKPSKFPKNHQNEKNNQ
jgi:hypothetical protein